jgi:twitching motility protein PilU
MKNLDAYLRMMAERRASDLLFTTGAPVSLKAEGNIEPVEPEPLAPGAVKQLVYGLINEQQRLVFERDKELNFGFTVDGLGRFRTNLHWQRGEASMVIRYVRSEIPGVESLGLRPDTKEFVMRNNGLVIVAGATGSGKSTTLAALLEHRNKTRNGHIYTIEDPIEYLFQHRKSIVTQREVGVDTLSYQNALREALRAAPDVIMLGEVRDRPTMESCLAYAAAGHVVVTTLHATNANQVMDRILNMFPLDQHPNLLLQLSLNLHAVISQRLVRGMDGRRVLASEILVNTPYISELIHKGETYKIKGLMEKGETSGMYSFDQSLVELYHTGKISVEAALANADSTSNVQWRLNFGAGGGESARRQLSS